MTIFIKFTDFHHFPPTPKKLHLLYGKTEAMEKISNILIPTDFSPAAWEAVNYGLSLAKVYHANITLLHVYPSENKYMSWIKPNSSGDNEILNQLKNKLKSFAEGLGSTNGTIIHFEVKSGNVTREIASLAKEKHFDLIIMGVNSGSGHNDPGSNTSDVIRNAGFPVLIIPNLKKETVLA